MLGISASVPWRRVNQRSVVQDDARRLVHARRDVLHARDLIADGIGVGAGQRRRRAKARRRIAEAIARRRVVVLLHRVVFGMDRQSVNVTLCRPGWYRAVEACRPTRRRASLPALASPVGV